MRILFLTAHYPPSTRGWGYMRICEQVADGLHARGHEIALLTSIHPDGTAQKPYPVHRLLHIDPDWDDWRPPSWQFFFGRRERERQDCRQLGRLVQEFRPQVIFVFQANNLSRAMLHQAENWDHVEAVYYIANYLPENKDEYIDYWHSKSHSILTGILKAALAPIALRILQAEGKPVRLKYPHSISVSSYVRERLVERDLIGEDAVVVPAGVDLESFHSHLNNGRWRGQTRVLVAGRISPEKGIHTLLHGIGKLMSRTPPLELTVTVKGDGPDPYRRQLEAIVADKKLGSIVNFEPPVHYSQMPEVLDNYDILVLPSEWDEPLASILLEAMAAGMLVLGTPTGGSPEVLKDMETGMVFEAGSAEQLAEKLSLAIERPELAEELARNGNRLVMRDFGLSTTVDRIEYHLRRIIKTNLR